MASLTRPNGPNSIFNSTIRIIQNAASKLQETAKAFFAERRVGTAPSPSVVINNNKTKVDGVQFTFKPKNTSYNREITSKKIVTTQRSDLDRNARKSSQSSNSIQLHNPKNSIPAITSKEIATTERSDLDHKILKSSKLLNPTAKASTLKEFSPSYTVKEYRANLKLFTNKDDLPYLGRTPFLHSIESLLDEQRCPNLHIQIKVDLDTTTRLKNKLTKIADVADRDAYEHSIDEMLAKLSTAHGELMNYKDYTDSCRLIVKPIFEKWEAFTKSVKEAEAYGETQGVYQIAISHIKAVANARREYEEVITSVANDWKKGNVEGLEAHVQGARHEKKKLTSGGIPSFLETHALAGKLIRDVTSRLNSPIVQTTPQVTM